MAEVINCGAFRLYRDGKSPYWQVRAEAAPREPLFRSTGEENKTLAMRKAKEIYANWANEKAFEPGGQVLFKDLWREYVEQQATFQKPGTMRRIESVGKLHLLPAFGNRFLEEIPGLWPRFVRTQKLKRPASMLFNERKYLLGPLQYAYENGILDRVPYIQTVKGKKQHPMRIFTDDEIRKILKACGENHELALFIRFGFFMGLRAGEIAQIMLEDIDLAAGTIHVRGPKTTKSDRVIALNQGLVDALKAQMKAVSGRSKFLFPQVHNTGTHKDQRVFDKAWQALKDELGLEGRFHDLRHSCANRLKQSQVPVAVAAAYLGMSIRVYDHTYGQLGKDDTRIASTVVRLPDPVESTVDAATRGRND